MKVKNFKLLEVIGKQPLDWKVIATVDVTKGVFKKTTETVEIYREYGCSWYFSLTGEFTPFNAVEKLVHVFEAQERKKIWDINYRG